MHDDRKRSMRFPLTVSAYPLRALLAVSRGPEDVAAHVAGLIQVAYLPYMPHTLLPSKTSPRLSSAAASFAPWPQTAAAQGQIGRGERSKGAALRPCDILSAARADRAIVRFKLQPRAMTVAVLEDLAALGWPAAPSPAQHRCPFGVLGSRCNLLAEAVVQVMVLLPHLALPCTLCRAVGPAGQDPRSALLAFRNSNVPGWEKALAAQGFSDPLAEAEGMAASFLVSRANPFGDGNFGGLQHCDPCGC